MDAIKRVYFFEILKIDDKFKKESLTKINVK